MDIIALFADVALDTISILQNSTDEWAGDGGIAVGDDGMGMGNGSTWDGVGNGTIVSPVDAGDVGGMDEGNYVLVRVRSVLQWECSAESRTRSLGY